MDGMTLLSWLLDGLLAAAVLWLAWLALAAEQTFKAIVLYVSFGLLMSLVWVRLNAPDIALAEAAIGGGLTGALLLAAMARMRRSRLAAPEAEQDGASEESAVKGAESEQ